eukprot:CAMPEP_0117533806 /NCGR_PEP_ID=MMETSP0784-20121206/40085_1 /TAXON_ID=39447 /ORGANISM="" /LENGTH=101 /DNA_ID=CAMNT_0005330265 /DNA_START=613 /DNA_END=918 /DNA_ORIENTATION=-
MLMLEETLVHSAFPELQGGLEVRAKAHARTRSMLVPLMLPKPHIARASKLGARGPKFLKVVLDVCESIDIEDLSVAELTTIPLWPQAMDRKGRGACALLHD